MVVKAVYLGCVIGDLVLITAFRFQAAAFSFSNFSFSVWPAPDRAPLDAMRGVCIAHIKTRLKRIDAGKNAGRSLFEMANCVACLSVIDSRNKPLRRSRKPFAPPLCCTL